MEQDATPGPPTSCLVCISALYSKPSTLNHFYQRTHTIQLPLINLKSIVRDIMFALYLPRTHPCVSIARNSFIPGVINFVAILIFILLCAISVFSEPLAGAN